MEEERNINFFTNFKHMKLLFAVIILLLIFYFKVFFQKGAYFDDTFLKKETISSESHYVGKNKYGDIHITVKGIKDVHKNAEVTYRLPNNINKTYIINYKDEKDWLAGIESITSNDIIMVSLGEYKNSRWLLADNNGKVIHDINLFFRDFNPYENKYNISLNNVANFGSYESDTIRGEFGLLFMAVILFAITIIDIKYPLIFFKLEHFLSVKNPEPSDLYLAMQKISWVLFPIIGAVLMLLAL